MIEEPLKQILQVARYWWDTIWFRPVVRENFDRMIRCRTLDLGGEVYASDTETKVVPHTCKSRTCPSCGHRATIRWQRERWAALPEVPYKGITFTMPDRLWNVFRDNRHLLSALPALAGRVIQMTASARYGVSVGIIAILHTFNGKLDFNCHVHTMVTAGGLHKISGSWLSRVYYGQDQLLDLWRAGVIDLLRTALRSDLLCTEMTIEQMEHLLNDQEKRWWSIRVQSFKSKEHFLQYAARYLRRPPIAQRRITRIEERDVTFWYKDKKRCQRLQVHCSPEEFIDRWAQHIPERYQHAVRFFGLFSPRMLSQTSVAIFSLLGQVRRPHPRTLPWSCSIKRDFEWDPLLDCCGQRMRWVRRLAPRAPLKLANRREATSGNYQNRRC